MTFRSGVYGTQRVASTSLRIVRMVFKLEGLDEQLAMVNKIQSGLNTAFQTMMTIVMLMPLITGGAAGFGAGFNNAWRTESAIAGMTTVQKIGGGIAGGAAGVGSAFMGMSMMQRFMVSGMGIIGILSMIMLIQQLTAKEEVDTGGRP